VDLARRQRPLQWRRRQEVADLGRPYLDLEARTTGNIVGSCVHATKDGMVTGAALGGGSGLVLRLAAVVDFGSRVAVLC
jgi:hypothetical protein